MVRFYQFFVGQSPPLVRKSVNLEASIQSLPTPTARKPAALPSFSNRKELSQARAEFHALPPCKSQLAQKKSFGNFRIKFSSSGSILVDLVEGPFSKVHCVHWTACLTTEGDSNGSLLPVICRAISSFGLVPIRRFGGVDSTKVPEAMSINRRRAFNSGAPRTD